jgi:hypothetical protein
MPMTARVLVGSSPLPDAFELLANEDFAIDRDTSELRAKLDASVDIALAANIPLIY